MSQTIYGWRYPEGDFDHGFIDYFEWAVWRKRWEHEGQHEGPDRWGPYEDFDHWAAAMKKEGHSVVPVRIVEVGPIEEGEEDEALGT